MCGIFGYWTRQPALDTLAPEQLDASLRAMADALVHRGPDDEGVWNQPARGVAIGNRRLSIIDIGGGHQPFVSDDGLIAVVQNGEIFNHIELATELRAQGVRLDTASDTEVILRLYEREGMAFVSRLNGMFAIAIDDAREDTLYLVRDRVGEKPLYVFDDGEHMQFASEIKSIVAFRHNQYAKLAIDFEAIHHYLSFNYIPAPWTIYQGVRHVMPGTWMRFSRGAGSAGVQTQRWWRLADQRECDMPYEAWAQEFLALLDDATRIRLRADVPFGAFLSGGVDSSSIVGLMARHVAEPVKSFCIGFADPRYDESAFAQQAADRFACQHTMEVAELNMLTRWPKVLHHLDQPHGDASFMPMLRVSELAAQHVKVVLTGDGGDELFAGYDKYAQFFAQEGLGDEASAARASSNEATSVDASAVDAFHRRYFDSISLFSPEAKQALYSPVMQERVGHIDSFATVAQPWLREAEVVGGYDRVNQALYLDMQLLLSGNNLVKPDRMGMAVSIEARAPFLDHRLMEFAFRSRGMTKLHVKDAKDAKDDDGGFEKKHWFKRAVTPLIGADLAYRKKQMFTVPIGDWFKADRHEWLRSLLLNSALTMSIVMPERVVSMLDQHRDGSKNYTRELRALAALALWAQAA